MLFIAKYGCLGQLADHVMILPARLHTHSAESSMHYILWLAALLSTRYSVVNEKHIQIPKF